jgi:hypothetical protein
MCQASLTWAVKKEGSIEEEEWVRLFREAGLTASTYGLRNAAILDSGATIHIFNEIVRFSHYRTEPTGDVIIIGKGQVPVIGYGDVRIEVQNGRRRVILKLRDVAHCPDFVTNVVSLERLNEEGLYWDNRASRQCIRRETDGSVVCQVSRQLGQYVLEYLSPNLGRAALYARHTAFDSWAARIPSEADGETWHQRLGHPGKEALQRTVEACSGIKIRGPALVECDECAKAKITRQIRRAPRNEANEADPGTRIELDFHEFGPGRSGMNHLMLLTDRASGLAWDYYLPNRNIDNQNRAAAQQVGRRAKRRSSLRPG